MHFPLKGSRSRARAVLIAAGWSLVILGGSHAGDWPHWRGPDGNGLSSEKDWKPQALGASPKILWKSNVGVGFSAVSIAARRLYTMGNAGGNDVVHCLEAETGKEVWKHSFPCSPGSNGYDGPRATPAVDGDLVYTLSNEGTAFCLDAATGTVKWQKSLTREFKAQVPQWGIAGSPLIADGSVLYNVGAHGLALDKATGAKVWESGPGACGYAAPLRFSNKGADCAAFFGAKELNVVDVKTGKKLLSHPWDTRFDVNAADPVFFDGKLLITSGYGHGAALLDVSGKQIRALWETKEMRGHFASPVYLDGHLYGVDDQTGTGKLRCLDAKNGQIKWTSKHNGYENLMIAAGKILAIDKLGELSVVDAAPGAFKEIARAAVLNGKVKNWTAPVLANGLVYCRNAAGDLVCVDLR